VTVDPGYVVAVADGLVFALGAEWERLSAGNPEISRDRVRAALARLDELGVRPSFGDGALPTIPPEGAVDVDTLADQLARIRDVAPRVLATGADTLSRNLCSDPWPRIYTTAVLDVPATSPVHVVQASDLASSDQWARVGSLAELRDIRLLIMFGAPLDRSPWPFAGNPFPDLRALDVSGSRMRALPSALAQATMLEALELADNPLESESLAPLAALPRLRYLNLQNTGLARRDLPHLPAECELAI